MELCVVLAHTHVDMSHMLICVALTHFTQNSTCVRGYTCVAVTCLFLQCRSMQLLPLLDSPLCKPVTEATSSQPVSVDTKQQPTTDDGSSQLVSVDTKQQPTTDDGPSQPVSVDTKQQPTTDDGSSQPVSVDTKQQPTTDDSSSQPITTDDAPLHAINLSSFESLCLSDKNTSVSNHPFNCGGGDEQFANKYIQQISDSLDIWLNTVGTKQHDHSEGVFHPPLHDMCVSQVQRSLFMSQLRSTLQSLGEGSGVMEMASSFRWVVSVSVFMIVSVP